MARDNPAGCDQTAAMGTTDLRWGRRELLDVGDVGIHVETSGPPDGPTLACLHGFASGTFTWAGIAEALAGDVRLVAWDRPPFGRSDRPPPRPGPDDPYGLPAELARTATLVERLAGERPVVLVGHSAGALLAVQLTLARTIPVAGLVLVAPAVDGGPPDLVRRLAGLPGSGLVAAPLLRAALLGATAFLRRSVQHPTPLTEATAAETGRTLRRPGTAEALWHLTTTWEPPALLGRLGEIDVPAVVVAGIDDRIVPVDVQRSVADALGAELHLVEGAGHAPHEQQPEVAAEVIRGFLHDLGMGER